LMKGKALFFKRLYLFNQMSGLLHEHLLIFSQISDCSALPSSPLPGEKPLSSI
jgi:hypothetical protein